MSDPYPDEPTAQTLTELRVLADLGLDTAGRDAAVARVRACLNAPSPPASRRPARSRGAVLVTVAAGVVLVVTVVLQPGASPDSAQALPILGRPATDARGVDIGQQLIDHGADLTQARVFTTSGGASYAFPTPDGICLALADPAGGYGQGCDSTERIKRHSLFVAISPTSGAAGSASGEFAAVLPDGVSSVTVRAPDGATTTVPAHSGIATASAPQDAEVTYAIAGAEIHHKIPRPIDGSSRVDCGDHLLIGPDVSTSDCD